MRIVTLSDGTVISVTSINAVTKILPSQEGDCDITHYYEIYIGNAAKPYVQSLDVSSIATRGVNKEVVQQRLNIALNEFTNERQKLIALWGLLME